MIEVEVGVENSRPSRQNVGIGKGKIVAADLEVQVALQCQVISLRQTKFKTVVGSRWRRWNRIER